jgi:hypothetical protein
MVGIDVLRALHPFLDAEDGCYLTFVVDDL